MGAVYGVEATTFRVWAPHANAVYVTGEFAGWAPKAYALQHEADGYWACAVAGVQPGQAYAFVITYQGQELWRVDPYAREVRGEGEKATAIVVDTEAFDWEGDNFRMPNWNEMVIYELHVGSFAPDAASGRGTFDTVRGKLEYLASLNVNCIKLMPPAEFDGEAGWGYNPVYPFAVETAYGGPHALKQLIKEAHRHGIAVLIDVVYNHLGPSGKHLWRFDGWGQGDFGGLYFYNDARAETPWGHTRLNYGLPQVRRYLIDNALMWLREYRADGLRIDSVSHIRATAGNPDDPTQDLPEGWLFLQELNQAVHAEFPWKLTVAEDLLCSEWVTAPTDKGGAGFDTQWDCNFIYPIREILTHAQDEDRSMQAVVQAIGFMYGGNAFNRVIFTESHDAVAQGNQRLPVEVDADRPDGYFAIKRAVLGMVLAAVSPGIPMIFQGQEFLTPDEFLFPETNALRWELAEVHAGIVRLTSDAFGLRRNLAGQSAGLTGQHVDFLHASEESRMLVFLRRKAEGGPGDDIVVAVNFSAEARVGYRIPLPASATYTVLLNTASKLYHPDFEDVGLTALDAERIAQDGYAFSAPLDIAPYSLLVLAQS